MKQIEPVRWIFPITLTVLVIGMTGLGCTRQRADAGPVTARTRQDEKVILRKWTPEQNLFHPVPKTAKNRNETSRWVYETIGGEVLALDEVWETTPVLLAFFEYAKPASHKAFKSAYQVDATYGTLIKVVGLNLYDKRQKMDPDELGGLLTEITSGLRYNPAFKGVYDYAEMLGMAIVQIPRDDELRQKFGRAGSGTATLIGIGGKTIYEGLKGEEIYARTEEYIKSLYEDQKYRVDDYGPAPRLKGATAKKSLWIFWMPDSLPSVEAIKALNEFPAETRGWSVELFTLASQAHATEVLQRVGGPMAKKKMHRITLADLEAVFGTSDLMLPALALVGEDGHLWYLGQGLWTAEDLGHILSKVEKIKKATG